MKSNQKSRQKKTPPSNSFLPGNRSGDCEFIRAAPPFVF